MKKLVLVMTTTLLFLMSACSSPTKTTRTVSKTTIKTNENLNSNEDYKRLFSPEFKHEITIEISKIEWEKMLREMKEYASKYGTYKSDTYYKANMIYKDRYGTIKIDQIGFRTKGNTSRVLPQNDDGSFNLSHFKIKFDETFDYQVNSTEFQRLNSRKMFDLKEINLKYNRNYDATYISEIFSYQIFNQVGINAPKATLSSFTIKIDNQETLLGVYSIFEPIDQEFLDKRYEKEESIGNLYKCLWQDYGPATLIRNYSSKAIGVKDASINYRPSYDLKTNKESPVYTDLKLFINNINNLTGSEFETYIEEHFEVESFIKLLALGALLGNPDDYRGLGNNYYLYFNSHKKKFEMIPYDYDHSLGQGWNGEPAFSSYSIGANIYKWPNNNEIWNQPAGNGSHPLADKILNIKKFQLKYEHYLNDYITPSQYIFNYQSFMEQYQNYKNLYNEDAIISYQRFAFGERNSRWYFDEKIKDIKNQLNYYKANPNQRGIR